MFPDVPSIMIMAIRSAGRIIDDKVQDNYYDIRLTFEFRNGYRRTNLFREIVFVFVCFSCWLCSVRGVL